jgi:hypothetical protein
MILRRNKTILPPTSIWTRGLNKTLLLLMSRWTQEPNLMPLTPARLQAVPGLLKTSAQAIRAPAQIKEKPLKYQMSGLTRHLLLLDKLHRPRRNNQHLKLQPLKRLLPRPRPLSWPSPALSK